MIDSKMKDKLAKFNKNFTKDRKRADELGGFAEVPDGKYLAKVCNCDLKNSNAGEMHFVFQFEIQESAEDESLVGVKVGKWCNVEREDGPAYLIRDLRRFGIDLEDLTQLPEIAKLIDDQKPEVKITLKTNNSGQFAYIDSVLSEMDAGDHAAKDGDNDEDEDEESDEEETKETKEEEESSQDDVQLKVGSKVSFTSKKGEEVAGEVVAMDEEAETVDIKAGNRSFKGIALDRLSVPEEDSGEEETADEEEEEQEEEKPALKKGKPLAKKVAKPAAKKVNKKR